MVFMRGSRNATRLAAQRVSGGAALGSWAVLLTQDLIRELSSLDIEQLRFPKRDFEKHFALLLSCPSSFLTPWMTW